MSDYDPQYALEAFERLPFSTPEKSQRYQTENYRGAVGLNWYLTDPTLQFTMAYYLQPDELALAERHLTRMGELMGGPVARWAEETDRNPPQLQRYDRWGHDVSHVVMPASFTQSKRAVLDAQRALRDEARAAKVSSGLAINATKSPTFRPRRTRSSPEDTLRSMRTSTCSQSVGWVSISSPNLCPLALSGITVPVMKLAASDAR